MSHNGFPIHKQQQNYLYLQQLPQQPLQSPQAPAATITRHPVTPSPTTTHTHSHQSTSPYDSRSPTSLSNSISPRPTPFIHSPYSYDGSPASLVGEVNSPYSYPGCQNPFPAPLNTSTPTTTTTRQSNIPAVRQPTSINSWFQPPTENDATSHSSPNGRLQTASQSSTITPQNFPNTNGTSSASTAISIQHTRTDANKPLNLQQIQPQPVATTSAAQATPPNAPFIDSSYGYAQFPTTYSAVQSAAITTSTQTTNTASLSSSAIFPPFSPPLGETTAPITTPDDLSNFIKLNGILHPQQSIATSSSQIETLTAEQKELIQSTVDYIATKITEKVTPIFKDYLLYKCCTPGSSQPKPHLKLSEAKINEVKSTPPNNLQKTIEIFFNLINEISDRPNREIPKLTGTILVHYKNLLNAKQKIERIKSNLAKELPAFCMPLVSITQKANPTVDATKELKKILDRLQHIFIICQQKIKNTPEDLKHTTARPAYNAILDPHNLFITLIQNLNRKHQENSVPNPTKTLENTEKIFSNFSNLPDCPLDSRHLGDTIFNIPSYSFINILQNHATRFLVNQTYTHPNYTYPQWPEILSAPLRDKYYLSEISKDIYTTTLGSKITTSQLRNSLEPFPSANEQQIREILSAIIQSLNNRTT